MTILDEESIRWRPAKEPPDDQVTVLTYAPDCGEPVWLGWHEDGTWFAIDGAEIVFDVIAWAPMPRGAGATQGSAMNRGDERGQ